MGAAFVSRKKNPLRRKNNFINPGKRGISL
jgi:hypothetical protein